VAPASRAWSKGHSQSSRTASKDIGAKTEDPRGDILVRAVNQADDGDHRRYAD